MLYVSLQIVLCPVVTSYWSTFKLFMHYTPAIDMAQVSARPDTFPLQVDELGRGTHIPPMTIDPQVRQYLESVMKPVLVGD